MVNEKAALLIRAYALKIGCTARTAEIYASLASHSGWTEADVDASEERDAAALARRARWAQEGGHCHRCKESVTDRRGGRCGGAPGSEHMWVDAKL